MEHCAWRTTPLLTRSSRNYRRKWKSNKYFAIKMDSWWQFKFLTQEFQRESCVLSKKPCRRGLNFVPRLIFVPTAVRQVYKSSHFILVDFQSIYWILVLLPRVITIWFSVIERCVVLYLSGPEWASLNRCVLICDECCSVHRSLGRHVSQVKHLRHSIWHPNLLTVGLNNSK